MTDRARKSVVIVSGLPRSGTSLMMNMLQSGGVPVVTDQIRTADEDNPKGYYEFERSKALKEGDFTWVEEAGGKAVKVISALLRYLPPEYDYKVIFMLRDLQEVLDSQRQMLIRRGQNPESVPDAEMKLIYQKHLAGVKSWLANQTNFQVLEVTYNQLFLTPQENVAQICSFLERDLDAGAMQAVIDVNLYRQRKGRP